jgi:epoxyqueuosine reductase
MSKSIFSAELKAKALELGFDLVGATPALPAADHDRFCRWLAEGRSGPLGYLRRRQEAYRHPAAVLEGVKSILMLGLNYRTVEPAVVGPGQALVSRYAWGRDYHEVIRRKLRLLAEFHRRLLPDAGVRGVVDTAPLFEKHYGRQAGLGWIGRNTLLINRRLGSWFFLAALLSTAELEYDLPETADLCGECRRCIDACPTGALSVENGLDARRCLSCLTIELHGPMPAEFRAACGNRLFGCDACQEVCPWNRETPRSGEPAFQPAEGMNPVELSEILALDEDDFNRRFRHSVLLRAGREGIRRNTAVVLENQSAALQQRHR